jgi:hypothetical protein
MAAAQVDARMRHADCRQAAFTQELRMNSNQKSFVSRAATAVALISAAAAVQAQTLSPAAYQQARTELQSSFRIEREACDAMAGNAKDICVETAKGREKVAMAHLEYQRNGDARQLAKFSEARLEARYDIAKERCDDQAGNAKDLCLSQARAERDKAAADQKLAKNLRDARADADATRAEADYKVARERCDTLSGDAKDACVAGARARFGQ